MPAKIRLQRHGKKKYAFFHIVVADSRAPRDGKFIEKIGTYNPNTNPATIDVNFERALHWVKVGAQPTDTARAILKYTGVIYKDHLDRGVKKGAFSQEEADKKFAKWLEEKQGKIDAKKDALAKAADKAEKERLAAETEAKEKKAAEIAAKNTPPAEEATAEEVSNEETPAAEAEASTEDATPVEETTEEAPETPKAEEAPAEEEKKEE